MHRIRWYGPTVLLLATTLVVMILGPRIARQIVWQQTDARIHLVQQSLAGNPALAQLNQAFEDVAEAVGPSVVHIEVLSRRDPRAASPPRDLFHDFRKPEQPQQPDDQQNALRRYGNGSGWVWDDRGHIVTNNHVITLEDNTTPVDQVRVKFSDGTIRVATVVHADPRSDLAVLHVDGAPLHPAARAADLARQGEIVFAFGSPFGNEFSMSQGIVSGIGRQLQISGDPLSHEQYIQTDAAINPGNSGGPLVNFRGEVIGINNAILTRTGVFSGVGYAIPVAQVERVVEQIIKNGDVNRGYLGVVIDDNPKWLRAKGYDGRGVFVLSVLEGEPAAVAGIERGDIIIAVNSIATPGVGALKEVVSATDPGKQVQVTVLRKLGPNDPGQNLTLAVTVARQPDPGSTFVLRDNRLETPEQPVDEMELLSRIGLENIENFSPDIAKELGIPYVPGVLIRSVRDNSVAQLENFQRGLVITEVMEKPIATIAQLVAELKQYDLKRGVIVTVENPVTRSAESRLLRSDEP